MYRRHIFRALLVFIIFFVLVLGIWWGLTHIGPQQWIGLLLVLGGVLATALAALASISQIFGINIKDIVQYFRRSRYASLSPSLEQSQIVVPISSSQLPPASSLVQSTHSALRPPHTREPHFVERHDESKQPIVEQVIELLDAPSGALVTLWGEGGVGKTTLANEVAHRWYDTYADRGVIWLSADGRVGYDLNMLLDETCTWLGREDARKLRLEEKISIAQTILSERLPLLVMDNFETVAEPNLIIAFLEEVACPIIVTSRDRLPSGQSLLIRSMTPTEADEFLRGLIERSTDRARLERVDHIQVAKVAERNPDVMRWVIGQLEDAWRLEDVLNELEHGAGSAADRIFGRSFGLLKEDEQTTLLALSLFVPNAQRPRLAEVADLSGDIRRFNQVVGRLARLKLLEAEADGEQLSIVGLTRQMATAKLGVDSRAEKICSRFVACWLAYIESFSLLDSSSLDAVENEKDNLVHAVGIASKMNVWESTIRLWSKVGEPFLWPRGYWDDYEVCAHWTLQVAQAFGEQMTIATIKSQALGYLAMERYDYEQATKFFSEALDIFRQLDNQEWICKIMSYLTTLETRRNNLDEAENICQRALDIAESQKFLQMVATLRNALGTIYRKRRHYDKAREQFDLSLEAYKILGEPNRATPTLRNLAVLEQDTGDLQAARQYLENILSIATENTDQNMTAGIYLMLAEIIKSEGDRKSALELARKAEAIFRQLRKYEHQNRAKKLIDELT